MTSLPRIADIQTAVAREYRVPFRIMREPDGMGTRMRDHARPRQAAMALAALLSEHSYVRIGQLFGGRDHSTVMAACRVVAVRRRGDPKLHSAMRRVSLELVRGVA